MAAPACGASRIQPDRRPGSQDASASRSREEPGVRAGVSISIARARKGERPAELWHRIDVALYRATNAGRNADRACGLAGHGDHQRAGRRRTGACESVTGQEWTDTWQQRIRRIVRWLASELGRSVERPDHTSADRSDRVVETCAGRLDGGELRRSLTLRGRRPSAAVLRATGGRASDRRWRGRHARASAPGSMPRPGCPGAVRAERS